MKYLSGGNCHQIVHRQLKSCTQTHLILSIKPTEKNWEKNEFQWLLRFKTTKWLIHRKLERCMFP